MANQAAVKVSAVETEGSNTQKEAQAGENTTIPMSLTEILQSKFKQAGSNENLSGGPVAKKKRTGRRGNLLTDYPDTLRPISQPQQQKAMKLAYPTEKSVSYILVTPESSTEYVHWGKEPEVKGFFLCNGPGCSYCQARNKPFEKIHIVAYRLDPFPGLVLFSFDKKNESGDLLPQLLNIFHSGKKVGVEIVKTNGINTVDTFEITDDMEMNTALVAFQNFEKTNPDGEVDLNEFYKEFSNAELESIPEVANVLKRKRITL
ncbi:MAG: hypothetical protein A2511_16255 [Deltaproteobacteria bacterium RIFOXYD12_FULL_50_9]|nr:MAG: hypothetical protein A2511_16255 [Deltaproteobacteria bacterium RIFOXYD12_FULL_50_9]